MAKLLKWRSCINPIEINIAITCNDPNWGGLNSADQIVSITYDTSNMCYMVFWTIENEV